MTFNVNVSDADCRAYPEESCRYLLRCSCPRSVRSTNILKMSRRDIILQRALAKNKEDNPSLIEVSTAIVPLLQSPLSALNTTSEHHHSNIPSVESNSNQSSIPSLEPPSFSPITPLITNNIDIVIEQSPSINENTFVNSPHSLETIQEDVERIEESPVRPMSPGTLNLYNTLLNSDDDDSVKDPNYSLSDCISDTSESESILIVNSRIPKKVLKSDIKSNSNDEIIVESSLYKKILDERSGINKEVLEKRSSVVHENLFEERSDTHEEIFDERNDTHEDILEERNRMNVERVEEISLVDLENNVIDLNAKIRPKKGRKRKFDDYTLAERKSRKYANLPYKGKSKEVGSKVFKDYRCNCKKRCYLLISEDKRKQEFDKFITLGSYEAQLLYICSNVTENAKKRSYVSENNKSGIKKPRCYSRLYKLCNTEVCRDMFINTLQITTQKVTISLNKNRESKLNDCRGKSSGGWNKTPQEEINFVCKVINLLPKYESHYRRSQNGEALYLQPGTNMQNVYDFYVDEYKKEYGETKKCVSLSIFRNIFLTKFNLRFKSLQKDTCYKCDTFAAKLKYQSTLPDDEKNRLLSEKHKHLKTAETLRSYMNSHIERAKVDETFECITFDMEKTLPLPRIPTNVVFYKRQLWFYNCGIHVASKNQGYCFVWVEGEAGRGAQEVGSCLTKFIKQNMMRPIEHLSLWSDSCGGQNRNIKMVLILKTVLANHPTLKTIELNFLEPGHTFLPNDTDFGKIESHLKHFQRLYTAEDYINVIKTCTKKNPLNVVKMNKKDFIGTEKLEKNITNRKTFVNKNKVNWLQTKNILLKKENIHSIFMKSFLEEEYQELNISRKLRGTLLPLSSDLLVSLWPNGKPITRSKLDDLKSMFHLIPEDCLPFYKELRGIDGVIDDIEGYGGELDFDLEIEERGLD